jgi:hypothetical protein
MFPSLKPPQNTTFHFAHMLQRVIGFSNHLFAPPLLHSQAARDAWSVSATRSAIATLIAATAQPSGSRLFLLCGIFPDAHSTKWNCSLTVWKILPTIHVLAAYSFHSFSNSSYLVIPAFVAFISFSTARKSGSFTHSVPVITGTPFLQSPPLPFPHSPSCQTEKQTPHKPTALIERFGKCKPRVWNPPKDYGINPQATAQGHLFRFLLSVSSPTLFRCLSIQLSLPVSISEPLN